MPRRPARLPPLPALRLPPLPARGRIVNLILLAVVVAAGVTAYFVTGTKTAAQAQVTTGTAQRGSVLSTVSASGNIQPAKTVQLSFSGTGKLVAVNVHPGQHVAQGEVLAKLDDSSEAGAVRTAQANLAAAEANVASLAQPLTPQDQKQNQVAVQQAQAAIASQNTALRDAAAASNQDLKALEKAVAQARTALKQAQKGSNASAVSLRNAVGEAKGAWLEAKASAAKDVATLQTALDQSNAQLARDQAQLASDQSDASTYTSQANDGTGSVASLQSQVNADKDQVTSLQVEQIKCNKTTPPCKDSTNIQINLTKAQAQLSSDQSSLSTAQSDQSSAQSKADAATSAVASDQTKIVGDQNAVTNAQNSLAAGQLKDSQSVTQALRAYVNAKTALTSGQLNNRQSAQSAQNTLKNALQSLQAGKVKDAQTLHSARGSVKSAKQSLASTLAANAVKAAPATAGDLASAQAQIASANASLANAIAAENQQTLFAPTFGTVATVSGSVGEIPASPFITLVDLARPEVLAGFSESDAAKIRIGQPATIQVDALPNTQLGAHVISIDTTQTVVSNVVTYGVTFLLDEAAPNVKPGMTVSAAVVIAKRDGVLHVPNAAVHTTGGGSFVTVVGSNGAQTEQAVQTGLVGDDATEIVSGLKANQEIVVATFTSSLTTTTPTGGGGGGFGGGGGGFRIPGGGFGG